MVIIIILPCIGVHVPSTSACQHNQLRCITITYHTEFLNMSVTDFLSALKSEVLKLIWLHLTTPTSHMTASFDHAH